MKKSNKLKKPIKSIKSIKRSGHTKAILVKKKVKKVSKITKFGHKKALILAGIVCLAILAIVMLFPIFKDSIIAGDSGGKAVLGNWSSSPQQPKNLKVKIVSSEQVDLTWETNLFANDDDKIIYYWKRYGVNETAKKSGYISVGTISGTSKPISRTRSGLKYIYKTSIKSTFLPGYKYEITLQMWRFNVGTNTPNEITAYTPTIGLISVAKWYQIDSFGREARVRFKSNLTKTSINRGYEYRCVNNDTKEELVGMELEAPIKSAADGYRISSTYVALKGNTCYMKNYLVIEKPDLKYYYGPEIKITL